MLANNYCILTLCLALSHQIYEDYPSELSVTGSFKVKRDYYYSVFKVNVRYLFIEPLLCFRHWSEFKAVNKFDTEPIFSRETYNRLVNQQISQMIQTVKNPIKTAKWANVSEELPRGQGVTRARGFWDRIFEQKLKNEKQLPPEGSGKMVGQPGVVSPWFMGCEISHTDLLPHASHRCSVSPCTPKGHAARDRNPVNWGFAYHSHAPPLWWCMDNYHL